MSSRDTRAWASEFEKVAKAAAEAPTLGEVLISDALPDGMEVRGPITKKEMTRMLVRVGREHPDMYGEVVERVKATGDLVATVDGLSVGMEDIRPNYKERDPVINKYFPLVKAEKDPQKRRKLLADAQAEMLKTMNNHPSTMGEMARSGGRGSQAQLMRTVASSVTATDGHGDVIPWMIRNSYAEGLTPDEFVVANAEARVNAIASKDSVQEPGAFAKVMTAAMSSLVITALDCGTKGGVPMKVDNPDLIDRLLAQPAGNYPYNTIITPEVAEGLRKQKKETVIARSPATCLQSEGLCARCYGLNERGQLQSIGTNVGLRSAQALSEPLTQFALNAKHGVRVADNGEYQLRGLEGMQQFTEFPQSFSRRAVLAPETGTITRVEKAAHGGFFIDMKGKKLHELYVQPQIPVHVKVGDQVMAGDMLTGGVAMPDDVVPHRGIGGGRAHVAETAQKIYAAQGKTIDRRHTELLARGQVAFVRVDKDPEGIYVPGDIVQYNPMQSRFTERTVVKPTSETLGATLGGGALTYTPGTRITERIRDELIANDVTHVDIYTGGLKIRPVATPLTRTPLLDPDWMARMQHRYLGRTLIDAALYGQSSDIHGVQPTPAYVYGAEFGQGPSGRY